MVVLEALFTACAQILCARAGVRTPAAAVASWNSRSPGNSHRVFSPHAQRYTPAVCTHANTGEEDLRAHPIVFKVVLGRLVLELVRGVEVHKGDCCCGNTPKEYSHLFWGEGFGERIRPDCTAPFSGLCGERGVGKTRCGTLIWHCHFGCFFERLPAAEMCNAVYTQRVIWCGLQGA